MAARPLIAASLALALFVVATQTHGLGISTDSVSYEAAAESLLERGSLEVPLTRWNSDEAYEPLTHFPPALPLTLAALGSLRGSDLRVAGRWLNAACLVATSLLVLTPLAESALAFSAACALLAGSSFVGAHLWLWSEPLFFLLIAASLRVAVSIRAGTATTSSRGLLLGFLCGLATLTRYAGVSLFAGFGVALWLSSRARGATRGLLAAYFFAYATAISPWLWWLARHNTSPRSLGFYPSDLWEGVAKPLARTMTSWAVPAALPLPLAAAAFAALVLGVIVAHARHRHEDGDARTEATVFVAGIVFVAHLAFLLAARLCADPGMPFDQRILSTALLLATIAVGASLKLSLARSLPLLPGVLIACVAVTNLAATAPRIGHAARHGNGFVADRWLQSKTIAWLQSAPAGIAIFSNAPDAVRARIPVTAKYTPARYDADRLPELAARVESSAPAVVVLFDDPHAGWLVSRARLLDALSGLRRRSFADAVVLTTGDETPE